MSVWRIGAHRSSCICVRRRSMTSPAARKDYVKSALDRVLANRRQKAFAQVVCLAGAHAFDRAKGVE